MRTHRLVFLLLLAATLPLATASCARAISHRAPEPCIPLTIVSWNIRVGVGADGKQDPEGVIGDIGRAIHDCGADIVLLQEVDRRSKRTDFLDEARMLADATDSHLAWAPGIVAGDSEYGIATLSRLPIESTRIIQLPKIDYSTTHPDVPSWFSEQRMALVARIPTSAGILSVINTHLGLTKEQRILQIEKLAVIAREELRSGYHVLLGGDLNAEPDASELAPLRGLLRDAYQDHKDESDLAVDLPIRSRLTFPATRPDRCIDYLFLSPATVALQDISVPDLALSDHLPVRGAVCLTPMR